MYFKRIELHGFKSFAEPAIIEFHPGITCIVGPNGSGKSNISDAIRWVLGEQSPKMLRGGKMEEVIFAGTTDRKSRGMAEVTLVLDNSKHILNIDYAEVAITRRVYRSGESEYYINNNQCRLRDIRELIMDTGIGVDGYSLIGQGKISDIVSNKPESRREIFEEAAGVVKYKSKKAETEKKLESSNHNLERINDIIGEIESRIDGLKEDSEKATEYLALKEQSKDVEINITLKNVESIELKNEYIKDDIMELTSSVSSKQKEKEDIDKDMTENKTLSESLERRSVEGNAKLLEVIEEINSLKNKSDLSKEKISAMDNDSRRLSMEIENIEEKLGRELSNVAEFLESKEEIAFAVNQLKVALENKTIVFNDRQSILNDLDRNIEKQRNELFQKHNEITSKTSEIASLESLQGNLSRRRDQILSEKTTMDISGADILKDFEEKQSSCMDLEKNMEKLNSEQKKQEENKKNLDAKTKEIDKSVEELKMALGNIAARKRVIEELENNYEGYNNAVKFVMGRKDRLRGIHGIVADLIEVPSGFETAIETALGASLQNIICENSEDARDAIDLLKSNRAGRITFLPIKSIKGQKYNGNQALYGIRGFKGIASEVLDFDEKYRAVAEYLLGKVVLMETLDDAIAASKGNFGGLRFVTLDGEIINSGGAITGGAHKHKTGGLLERKAEIKKLFDKGIELQKKYNEQLKQKDLLESKLKENIELSLMIDTEIRNTEKVVINLKATISGLQDRITEITSSNLKWENELKSIDEEIETSQKMIESLKGLVASLEKEREACSGKVEEYITASAEKKTELDDASEDVTAARLEMGQMESELSQVSGMLDRIEKYKEELLSERQKKEQEILTIEERKQVLLSDTEGSYESLQDKEQRRTDTEEDLAKIQEEKVLISNYLDHVTKKKETMDSSIFSLQSQKHELEIKLAKNEMQVDTYKNKIWDDFEISYIQAMDFADRDFVMSQAVKIARELKGKMKALGEINVGAIKEYETTNERYQFLKEQRQDVLDAIDALKQIIAEMDKNIRTSFKESFDKISENFKDTFQKLFGGGEADLKLEDETKPLESGIEIVAQPPGKKLQNITLLSGGEKTMTAIALMFAVLKVKPTPFCILDEVEAALDDHNIVRFIDYLKIFDEIQFTLITHQKATMERADVLYGVTMPEHGISKVLSLKFSEEVAAEFTQ